MKSQSVDNFILFNIFGKRNKISYHIYSTVFTLRHLNSLLYLI